MIFFLYQGLLVRNKDDHKRKWGREEKELHRKMDIFQRFSTKEVRIFNACSLAASCLPHVCLTFQSHSAPKRTLLALMFRTKNERLN